MFQETSRELLSVASCWIFKDFQFSCFFFALESARKYIKRTEFRMRMSCTWEKNKLGHIILLSPREMSFQFTFHFEKNYLVKENWKPLVTTSKNQWRSCVVKFKRRNEMWADYCSSSYRLSFLSLSFFRSTR